MNLCIYIRDLKQWAQVPGAVISKTDTVFCGDYGCPGVLPSVRELVDFKSQLLPQNMKVHYISPKVTQVMMDEEEARVLEFMECGIGISINDWGLLYRLKSKIQPQHEIYLGRLLTKSIADWIWSGIFFEKEKDDAIDYLSQNNFNHDKKIEYFKRWGIRGIEVNIHKRGESSYASIRKQGFSVIGYADNTIAAVSRACPFLKIKGMDYARGRCRDLCREKHRLYPCGEKEQQVYPDFELYGNVIYLKNQDELSWTGYDKLVYTWTP